MIILADDLTGANDTAIQFVKYGLSALVIPHVNFPDSALNGAYDVVLINSDSRAMEENAAYNTVRSLIKRITALGFSRGYNKLEKHFKKIDSVLRGNQGPELAAMMDELKIPLAIVAPSFPVNRSIVEQGMLKSGAANVTIDAVKVLTSKMNKMAESIPLEKIRLGESEAAKYILNRIKHGIEVFVADALCDNDLAIIYRLSAAIPHPHILAGSAGLANQIAKTQKSEQPALKRPVFPDGNCPSVLIIAGTRQEETAAQIATLSESFSVPVIRFRTALAASGKGDEAAALAFEEAALIKKNLCIIAVDSLFKSDNAAFEKAESKVISSSLGSLARRFMEAFQFPVIVSTGGDTSLEVCKCLDVTKIEPLAEISPGIPICRIAGGNYENRYIITKSGRFGNSKTLIEIMDFLGVLRFNQA